MKVMKFGSSSLQDSARIRATVSIILAEKARKAVVLSAMRGITEKLIAAAGEAERGQESCHEHVREIALRQAQTVEELLPGGGGTLSRLNGLLGELEEILTGIELLRECSPRSLDLVMSFGERLNCTLVADYIASLGQPALYLDAREILRTDDSHGAAEVDFAESHRLIRERFAGLSAIPVVTGLIAASKEGATTTLGRNGSDYTASILGAALGAEAIEIWTDVDGVMSADPRFVASAFVIPEMGYQEAMELSYFGAKVLHPNTMIPAIEKGIPILIKNALNPSAPGTLISRSARPNPRAITGIASIENVALINVEGGGMIGVPGFASRVFSALARAGANVIMISQASSEHSICLVVRASEAEIAMRSLSRELARESAAGRIQEPQLVHDLEVIAVIGENMRGTPGISGRLFSALGADRINVLAIAQGSSERNISLVIERKDKLKALGAIHRAFLEEV